MSDNVPISKRIVLVNSAGSIVAQLVNIAVLIWVIQHLIKRIPPEEYQLLPVVMSIVMFFPIIQSLLDAGLGRFLTEQHAKNNNSKVTELVSSAFFTTLGASLILAAPFTAAVWHADLIIRAPEEMLGDARIMLAIALGGLLIGLPLSPFRVGLYVQQRFLLRSAITTCGTLLRAVLLITLILGLGPRVIWVITSTCVAGLFTSVTISFISVRSLNSLRVKPGCIRWAWIKKLASFGFWVSIGRAANSMRDTSQPIVLNKLAGAIDVNSFHVSSVIDRNLRLLTVLALSPLEPSMIAMHARGELARLRAAFLRSTRIILWLIMAPSVLLIIYREEIMRLFLSHEFDRYSDATTVVALLAFANAPFFATSLIHQVTVAQGRVGRFAVLNLIIQIFNIGLMITLVSVYGMGAVGAAWAMFLTNTLGSAFVFLPFAMKITNCSLWIYLKTSLMPGLAPFAISIAFAQLFSVVEFDSNKVFLFANCCFLIIIYMLLILLVARPEDRRDLQTLVAGVRGKLGL